jgi:hypothetical protein
MHSEPLPLKVFGHFDYLFNIGIAPIPNAPCFVICTEAPSSMTKIKQHERTQAQVARHSDCRMHVLSQGNRPTNGKGRRSTS